jgi:hypothetical protein
MTTVTQKMLTQLFLYDKSPGAIEQVSLDLLEEALKDKDIVDPSNPFMYLLGTAATFTYSAITKSESVLRKAYPQLAQTNRQLYSHMSNNDLDGVFASPATSQIKVMLNYDLILQYAYPVSGPGLRHIVIPRNTKFIVNGIYLGIHFPIQITVLETGALNIVYLDAGENPYRSLTSNIVQYRPVILNGSRYIEMTLDVEQFDMETSFFTIDNTSSFKVAVPVKDKFMYIVPWFLSNGQWVRMNVTYSDQVYDISQPTMIVDVDGNIANIQMPDVYQSLYKIANLRVDVYSCQGAMDIDLSGLPADNFSATWGNVNTYETDVMKSRINAMNKLSGFIISSIDKISGGVDGKTFGQIKNQIVYRSGANRAPVLPSDIVKIMDDLNYRVTKYVDNVTDRVYVATKPLPARFKKELEVTANTTLNDVILDIKSIPAEFNYAIKDNGLRTTLTPLTLFAMFQDTLQVEPVIDPDNLWASGLSITDSIEDSPTVDKDIIAGKLNNQSFFYTPFFYVIDNSLATLKTRAYQLDNPKIVSRYFDSNTGNVNDKYSIGTTNISVALKKERVFVGSYYEINWYYEFTVEATVSNITGYSTVDYYAQLKSGIDVLAEGYPIAPPLNGKINYVFRVDTELDVDQLNMIDLRNVGGNKKRVHISEQRIDVGDVITMTYDVQLDGGIDTFGTIETMDVEFGKYLEGLYIPSKVVLKDIQYMKYTADVPLTWPERIYARYAEGNLEGKPAGALIVNVGLDGEPQLVIEHELGDPVLNSEGGPCYLHRAGDYIIDGNGKYIVDNANSDVRVQLGVFMVSAMYRFATDTDTVAYRNDIPNIVRGYLENEIVPRDRLLNERTDLFYKPKGTIGPIRVNIGSDITTVVDSTVAFAVKVYVTKNGLLNSDLLKKISILIKNTIINAVNNTYLSVFELEDSIKRAAGSDVISVSVEKFGKGKDIPIMQLVDDSTAFSVKDKMELLSGGILDIADDIQIDFIKLNT